MYRLSSRGTKNRLSNSLESSDDHQLQVSDILVPLYINEETRRQRLKDNLNRMWQNSVEQAQRSERTGISSPNHQDVNAQYVSRTAELVENRSRRRNLQTINYLETLKRRQIMAANGGGDKKSNNSHTEFFKNADKAANRRAMTANAPWHPPSSSPLHLMPRSTSRVLIEKMIPPSSKSYQRQIREKEKRKKTQIDFEFAEIEDSIKTILRKSDQRRPETTSMILQNLRDKSAENTMTLGPSSLAPPPTRAQYTTSSGTSMLTDAATNSFATKIVQKRHKFIQSTPIVLTNSGCQTDPIEPTVIVIKEESKQSTKVDIADLTKLNEMSFDNSSDMNTKMENMNLGAVEGSDGTTTVVKIAEVRSRSRRRKRRCLPMRYIV